MRAIAERSLIMGIPLEIDKSEQQSTPSLPNCKDVAHLLAAYLQ
jgi:hypothetical protein